MPQRRLLRHSLRQSVDQRADPLGASPQHGVHKARGAGGAPGPNELDGLVHSRPRRHGVHERELVGPEPKPSPDGDVEAGHGPPADLLERVVERADALDRPVGEALCERPVARVELGGLRRERPVGVGAFVEDADERPVARPGGRGRSPQTTLELVRRHAAAPLRLHLEELQAPAVREPRAPDEHRPAMKLSSRADVR